MKSKLLIGTIILTLFVFSSCSKKEYNHFATLHGIVSDSETGEPISNASVVLSPGGKTKVTGTDGRYEFPDLDPQQYTITVQKTGYSTNRKTVTAIVGETSEANITLIRNE